MLVADKFTAHPLPTTFQPLAPVNLVHKSSHRMWENGSQTNGRFYKPQNVERTSEKFA